MAAALDAIPPAPSINKMNSYMPAAKNMGSRSCPECGVPVKAERAAEEAQRKIQELEAQAELLKEKATAAGMLTWRTTLLLPGGCIRPLLDCPANTMNS